MFDIIYDVLIDMNCFVMLVIELIENVCFLIYKCVFKKLYILENLYMIRNWYYVNEMME